MSRMLTNSDEYEWFDHRLLFKHQKHAKIYTILASSFMAKPFHISAIYNHVYRSRASIPDAFMLKVNLVFRILLRNIVPRDWDLRFRHWFKGTRLPSMKENTEQNLVMRLCQYCHSLLPCFVPVYDLLSQGRSPAEGVGRVWG